MEKELAEFRSQLGGASRLESRFVIEKIREVERKLNSYTKQLGSFDEKAKRYSTTIARLTEKAFKSSIKTTILGKDADKSEYWHFKDDCNRLYVRVETQVPIKEDNVDMAEELAVQKESTKVDSEGKVTEPATTMIETGDQKVEDNGVVPQEEIPVITPTKTVFSWHYYEREDQFEELFESLNIKGQRERKLQENLKKIKDRLKLKKPKKVKVSENATNTVNDNTSIAKESKHDTESKLD